MWVFCPRGVVRVGSPKLPVGLLGRVGGPKVRGGAAQSCLTVKLQILQPA